MRTFFMNPDKRQGQTAIIDGDEAKHIKTVNRLKIGDHIGLIDGRGWSYQACIEAYENQAVRVSILAQERSRQESPLRLTVAQALLKDRKMDTLVRSLTELGISHWAPFFCRRSVPQPDAKRLASRRQRWLKIASEALKQCGRAALPQIDLPIAFTDLLAQIPAQALKLICWEKDAFTAAAPKFYADKALRSDHVVLLIGPEGGFSEEEIGLARENGFVTMGLGPRILRAETAAIAACALVQHRYGDLSQKVLDNP